MTYQNKAVETYIVPQNVYREGNLIAPAIGNHPVHELANGRKGDRVGYLYEAIDARVPVSISRTASGWFLGMGLDSQWHFVKGITEERALELLHFARTERTPADPDLEREELFRAWVALSGPYRYQPKSAVVNLNPALDRIILHGVAREDGPQGMRREEREVEVIRILMESDLPIPLQPNPRQRWVIADFAVREMLPALFREAGYPEFAAEVLQLPRIIDEVSAREAAYIVMIYQEPCKPHYGLRDGGTMAHQVWNAAQAAEYAAKGNDLQVAEQAMNLVKTAADADELLTRVLAVK